MRLSWTILLSPILALACESAAGRSAQVSVTPEGAGANCAHGGVAVRSTSGAGTTSTSYICNGAPGADGRDGTSPVVTAVPASDVVRCPSGKGGIEVQAGSGSPIVVCTGADGQGTTITPLGAGDARCPSGGVTVQAGSGTPAYACNGPSATVTPLPSGDATCPTGGLKLQSASGTPVYACNGSMVWSTIAASGRAYANNGYIARSATALSLELAPSSTFDAGDQVKLLVDGAGPVSVMPAAGQSFRFDAGELSLPLGWVTTAAPSTAWSDLATSSDGTRLVATVPYTGIYTSSDSGNTWSKTNAPGLNWLAVATSSDGTRLAAVAFGDGIYTSSDAGVTWAQSSAPVQYWYTIAASSDGLRLAAGCAQGIFLSSDGGASWSPSGASLAGWGAIASSATGANLLASMAGGAVEVWASKDYGATWTKVMSPPSAGDWSAVASSSDGSRLMIAGRRAGVWLSADSGSTWAKAGLSDSIRWTGVASSADGVKLVACASPGTVHVSIDAGATWTATTFPASGCDALTSSPDGSKVFAAVDVGGIYRMGTGGLVAHAWASLELTYVGGGAFFVSDVTGTVEAP